MAVPRHPFVSSATAVSTTHGRAIQSVVLRSDAFAKAQIVRNRNHRSREIGQLDEQTSARCTCQSSLGMVPVAWPSLIHREGRRRRTHFTIIGDTTR